MNKRDTGKIVFSRPKYSHQGADFKRLIFRNRQAPAEFNPGALIFKDDKLPGPTSIVWYCDELIEEDGHKFCVVHGWEYYARWDADKSLRWPDNFDVLLAPDTKSRFQFYFMSAIIDAPPIILQNSLKTRLRPASNIGDTLRLCITAISLDDYCSKSYETGIIARPELTICAFQVGGISLKKKFTPSYKKVPCVDELGVFHGWRVPNPSEDDACVSINFNERGELVSMT